MNLSINSGSVITDAHPLLWYLTNDKRLSPVARDTFGRVKADELILIIPAVVLAEMYMVVEKGRLALPLDQFVKAVKEWQTANNILLTSLTPDIVIASSPLTAIPEIFDRLIVAEARKLGVALITRDPLIVDSKLVQIIW